MRAFLSSRCSWLSNHLNADWHRRAGWYLSGCLCHHHHDLVWLHNSILPSHKAADATSVIHSACLHWPMSHKTSNRCSIIPGWTYALVILKFKLCAVRGQNGFDFEVFLYSNQEKEKRKKGSLAKSALSWTPEFITENIHEIFVIFGPIVCAV